MNEKQEYGHNVYFIYWYSMSFTMYVYIHIEYICLCWVISQPVISCAIFLIFWFILSKNVRFVEDTKGIISIFMYTAVAWCALNLRHMAPPAIIIILWWTRCNSNWLLIIWSVHLATTYVWYALLNNIICYCMMRYSKVNKHSTFAALWSCKNLWLIIMKYAIIGVCWRNQNAK